MCCPAQSEVGSLSHLTTLSGSTQSAVWAHSPKVGSISVLYPSIEYYHILRTLHVSVSTTCMRKDFGVQISEECRA